MTDKYGIPDDGLAVTVGDWWCGQSREAKLVVTDSGCYGCGWALEGKWVDQVCRSKDNAVLYETVNGKVTVDLPVEEWPSQEEYDRVHGKDQS